MRLFKLFLFFSLYPLFQPYISAQDSNSVNYSLFIEKRGSILNINTKVSEGVFKEGSSFIIPEAQLTGEFEIYQDLYNALVGGRFGIEYGALDKDIEMKIYIRNLNKEYGIYENMGLKGDTLFSYFEIRIWELPDSNFFHEDTSYYLNEGFHAWFSLKKSAALNTFLNLIGIGTTDSLAFAFMENIENVGEDWNGYGIETLETEDSIMFKAIHLSRIGGGRRNIAENIYVPGVVNDVEIKLSDRIPSQIELDQNYPNPFNPTTNISYSLISSGNVKLKIYDIIGNHVATLVDRYQNQGSYKLKFNSTSYNLPSGMYIYSLEIGGIIKSKKMILMK